MIQKQLLDLPILYLSAFIIREKDEYYELLNKVTTQRTWGNWILYILKGIEETSIYTINKIEEIDQLFNKTWRLVQDNQLSVPGKIIPRV